MTVDRSAPEGWSAVTRPPSLFRRFEFSSYAHTRAFLDRLAELSERTGIYPDLGFDRTHVNVTLHAQPDGRFEESQLEFAARAAEYAVAEGAAR